MSETKEKAGKLKVKAKILKPKNLSSNDEPIKVDLSKPKTEEQDAIQVGETKRYLWLKHPEIARKWTNKYKSPARLLKFKKKNL